MFDVVRVNLTPWVLELSELAVVNLVLLEDAELRVDTNNVLRYSGAVRVALQVLQAKLLYVKTGQT